MPEGIVDIKDVPPDIENPNSIVTITNPNDEDFVFYHGGEEFVFPAKKEVQMIKFIAVHGAKHLAKSKLIKEAQIKELEFARENPKQDNPYIRGVAPADIQKLANSYIKEKNQGAKEKMDKARATRGPGRPKKEEEKPFTDLKEIDKNF